MPPTDPLLAEYANICHLLGVSTLNGDNWHQYRDDLWSPYYAALHLTRAIDNRQRHQWEIGDVYCANVKSDALAVPEDWVEVQVPPEGCWNFPQIRGPILTFRELKSQ